MLLGEKNTDCELVQKYFWRGHNTISMHADKQTGGEVQDCKDLHRIHHAIMLRVHDATASNGYSQYGFNKVE